MFRLYDKKAYELLKKCSNKRDMSEWNEYREKTGNQKVNLSFANLRGFYLQGANLQNVDFRFASLYNAEMQNSDVDNAKITTKSNIIILIVFVIAFTFIALKAISIDIIISDTYFIQPLFVAIVLSYAFYHMPSAVISTAIYITSIMYLRFFNTYNIFNFIMSMLPIVLTFRIILKDIQNNNMSISMAINPEKAIGFNQAYSIYSLDMLLRKLEEESKKTIGDDNKKNEMLRTIEALKQQKTIEKAIETLKNPYKYLEDEIKKLRIHNYFFYALIVASISIIVWYGMSEYQNREGYMGVLFGDVKSVDFGSIVGISLFYGTPIIFLTFVIVYAVSQINKNIDKAHELSTQKHYIEILESAFNSKTQAGATDEEIQKDLKMAADTIRDATIAKMLGKEKKEEDKESAKKDRYREIVDAKAAFGLFSTMLKNSK